MSKNNIKRFRTDLKMSQAELAEKAGTSQQQIQRIETCTIEAKIQLALKISEALNKPLNSVFPGSAKALRKLATEKKKGYIDAGTLSEIAAYGLEADTSLHTLKIQLQGHKESLFFEVSPQESRRLFKVIQNETDYGVPFIVFDTPGYRVGINLRELSYCHFLFDPGVSTSEFEAYDDIEVYLLQQTEPLIFHAEPDEGGSGEEESEDGQLNGIFFDLEMDMDTTHRIHFVDLDGDDVFLRLANVAMIKVPLWLIDPNLNSDNEKDNG